MPSDPHHYINDSSDKHNMARKSIGEGAFGSVWAYSEDQTAMKIVGIKTDDLTNLQACVREIHCLKYKNKYIVPLKKIVYQYSSIEMHLQLMSTDLRKYVKEQGELVSNETTIILKDCLHGIHFLHNHSIAHRDIKPSNILLTIHGDNKIRAKLCDFGLSRQFSNELHRGSDYMVTRWYRAPEIINQKESYGQAIDEWAMGCIIYEMMTGRPLFPLKHQSELEVLLKRLPVYLNQVSDPTLRFVCQNLLRKDPQQRWTSKMALHFLKEEVDDTSSMNYYTQDIYVTEERKKEIEKLLEKYPDMTRVIMHAMVLFNGTTKTDFDFCCAMIAAYLLFASDVTVDFFDIFWERIEEDCKKVGEWVCTYMNKYPHALSMWEKTKDTKSVMDSVLIDVQLHRDKKRKRLH